MDNWTIISHIRTNSLRLITEIDSLVVELEDFDYSYHSYNFYRSVRSIISSCPTLPISFLSDTLEYLIKNKKTDTNNEDSERIIWSFIRACLLCANVGWLDITQVQNRGRSQYHLIKAEPLDPIEEMAQPLPESVLQTFGSEINPQNLYSVVLGYNPLFHHVEVIRMTDVSCDQWAKEKLWTYPSYYSLLQPTMHLRDYQYVRRQKNRKFLLNK